MAAPGGLWECWPGWTLPYSSSFSPESSLCAGFAAAGLSGHYGRSERSLRCHCDRGRHPGLFHGVPSGQTREEGHPVGAGTGVPSALLTLGTVPLSSPRERFPEPADFGGRSDCQLLGSLQLCCLVYFVTRQRKFHRPQDPHWVSRLIASFYGLPGSCPRSRRVPGPVPFLLATQSLLCQKG